MKRILYTILPLLLLTAACVREIPGTLEEPLAEPTVPIVISLAQPVTLQATDATKAADMLMADTPSIANIHVAVFGSSGYLKDYVSAVPCDSEGNAISDFAQANNTASYFLVRLPVSTSSRIVHIIANGPSSMEFNAYEGDIMKSLSVTDGIGAYWQRLDLTGGITVETTTNTAGQTVYEQDANGEYIPTYATRTAFSNLKLVRNFAGITVTDSADNFQLVSYTLCNMPKSGAIAIYSTEHNNWVSDYCDKSITAATGIMTFDDHDYAGFPTNPELDTYIPDTEPRFNAASSPAGETVYVYERAAVRENPPFILMAARWKESGDPSSEDIKYYRLDITKGDEYFPFYRNYQYSLDITSCDIQGYDTPGEAARHNSGSNFSVSMDTQELNEVANAKVRLILEKTNYDILYSGDTQEFWFKFIKTEGSVNLNGNVTVTEMTGGNALASYTLEGSDRADNKRYVTFTLNNPGANDVLTSTLRIVGSYSESSKNFELVREVNIRTVNARSSTPSLSPNPVAALAGQKTTLTIPLPLDMPKSMFPQEFLVEDSNKILNPDASESMPVRTGVKSLTDNATPSYYFVRTLNWSEYERLVKDAQASGNDTAPLTCKFVTTEGFSSTTVYVANGFFSKTAGVTDAQVILTGDAADYIAPNDKTFSGTTANVDVNASGTWNLSITLANGNAATSVSSISPNSGSSTSGTPVDVTLTFAENDSENAIRYLLTLTNTSTSETRLAYLTQEGVSMSLRVSPSASLPVASGGVNNFPVKVNSGGSYKLQTLDAAGNVLWESGTYGATTSETDREVTIPSTDLNTERQVTIRAINNYGTIKKDVKVTQSAGTASITLANDEIRKATTTNTVTVNTNISGTVLKVYNTADPGSPVQTVDSPLSSSETITVGENTTSSDRHFRVDLCNASGRVLDTKSFTQLGVAALYLTAAKTSIENNETSVSLNVDSDADWTASVSGGLGGTLSAASGSAGNTNAVTLTVPVNNTTSAQTYTVTADNGSSTKSVTITQAAGVASLAQVDSEIMMQETSARVSVTTSFATVLKVFNNDTNEVVGTPQNLASTGSVASQKTVTVGAQTGSAITYRVQLYNSNDDPVGSSITFVQKPTIRISAPSTSVAGNANASVTVTSDVDWQLTSTNGGTFGTYSGTRCTNEGVTVNMPVNYTTSDVTFTITAAGTSEAIEDAVNITHRAATVNDGSQSFSTVRNGDFTSSTSATKGNVTATFSAVSQYPSITRAYLTLAASGTTLSINTASIPNKKSITELTMTFSANNYTTTSVTVQGTTATTASTTATSWTGTDTADETVFELYRNNNTLRMTGFTVSYQYYTWD